MAIHGYLRETGQLTREKEAELKQAHQRALQRILSFESREGGFGWYGGQEADTALTAYGTLFLADLARVYDFDRGILDRAVRFLEKTQTARGTWEGTVRHASWRRLSDAAIPSTAYVAWALKTAGRDDTVPLGKAEQFLRGAATEDGYALALIANAFPTRENLDRLSKKAKEGKWTTELQSWNHARGGAADLETTALAVLALARTHPVLADEGAGALVRSKDPSGAWPSTQATVLALKALTAVGTGQGKPVAARLTVNGTAIPDAFRESPERQSFDISPWLRSGNNEIELETSGRVNAQILGRYYLPWGAGDLVRGVEGLNLQVSYDRTAVKVGETVTCTVKVEADAFMVIAEVGLPPGFTVDGAALEELVRRKVVDKYSQSGRTLTFYLPGKNATFAYPLKPRYPAQVTVPPSVVYEYYTPERRVISPPQEVVVGR